MTLLETFLGRTQAERDALDRIIMHEDEAFTIQPEELNNLAEHTRREIPRFRVLRDRQALYQAVNNRKHDRNWYTLLLVLAITFARIFFPIDVIATYADKIFWKIF